jgi:hypothetical protein
VLCSVGGNRDTLTANVNILQQIEVVPPNDKPERFRAVLQRLFGTTTVAAAPGDTGPPTHGIKLDHGKAIIFVSHKSTCHTLADVSRTLLCVTCGFNSAAHAGAVACGLLR